MSFLTSLAGDSRLYQIYPQSYAVPTAMHRDLPGITCPPDYLQSLGVNAVWINPCFVSPFQDAGYDVSDYYRVAPRYGNNDDLQRLCVEAGKRGIRILLDLVPGIPPSNTPGSRPLQTRRNAYSAWYIWTDSVGRRLLLDCKMCAVTPNGMLPTSPLFLFPPLSITDSPHQESWQQRWTRQGRRPSGKRSATS
jgi:maltose alpha-D-glucosyltransferase/alpha-amylase